MQPRQPKESYYAINGLPLRRPFDGVRTGS